MKTLIIAGAGQFGRSAAGLLNTENYDPIGFADNNPNLWGTVYRHPLGMELPITSMEEAVRRQPDCILIGVIDPDRTAQLTDQLRGLGYEGRILTLREDYTHLDVRSATLLRLACRVHELEVPGAVAELGVYRGDLAWKLGALFPDRDLYLFDTFEGFDSRDVAQEQERDCSRARESDFSDTSMELVRNRLPHPERAIFRKGFFPETASGLEEISYAFVSLDADLYAPILAGLEYFWPRMTPGGILLLHDYNNERFRGARAAVTDYEKAHGPLPLVPLCDLHGSAVLVKMT